MNTLKYSKLSPSTFVQFCSLGWPVCRVLCAILYAYIMVWMEKSPFEISDREIP